MQMRLTTRPLAKFTRRWAEPCVAGMSLVDMIAVNKRLVFDMIEHTNETNPT